MDGNDVEAVVEIFSEEFLFNSLFHGAIGGGDEADIDLNRLHPAHPLKFHLLDSAQQFGLQDEPTVQEAVTQGADIITFSGDKLVGGPQAGIILGETGVITAIARNPLTRALRIDKLTLAALEATLRLYSCDPDCFRHIPVLSMLSVAENTLKKCARMIARALKKHAIPMDIAVVQDSSKIGGGSYPLHDLPTWAVSLAPQTMSPQDLERKLRTGTPPVIVRINRERVISSFCSPNRSAD